MYVHDSNLGILLHYNALQRCETVLESMQTHTYTYSDLALPDQYAVCWFWVKDVSCDDSCCSVDSSCIINRGNTDNDFITTYEICINCCVIQLDFCLLLCNVLNYPITPYQSVHG